MLIVSWLIFTLFIWFETDAFIWWFKWVKWLKIDEYNDYREEMDISYPDWVYLKKPNLLTKILSCPPCLLFWLCLPFGLIFLPLHYFSSYVIYRLIKKISQ